MAGLPGGGARGVAAAGGSVAGDEAVDEAARLLVVGGDGETERKLNELLQEVLAEAEIAEGLEPGIEGGIEIGNDLVELVGDGGGHLGAVEAEDEDEGIAFADHHIDGLHEV